jgi:hypothetical protein
VRQGSTGGVQQPRLAIMTMPEEPHISYVRVALVMYWLVCLPLDPRFTGSNLAETTIFKGNINPLHTFLRRGLKARGPMSVTFYNM